ncbi:MAG: FecR domain-containing protein [Opitutae bacterium]|nr:FecR domain-containing protein [Opitutae bacterium]
MNPADPNHSASDPIAHAAAEWVLRLDRGLTPAEQDAYTQWLAADPRHREALATARWGWDELDRLTGIQDSVHAVPDPDLLRPRRRAARVLRFWPQALGLAAAVALAAVLWWPRAASMISPPVERAPSYALAAPIEKRTLEDGTVVSLNRGAVLEVNFAPEERRVHLVRGEANFAVAKNPLRPFIVQAAGVNVRAVGTEFNVRLDPKAVEVLVTEGKVEVTPPPAAAAVRTTPPLVEEGQRTVVSLEPSAAAPQVLRVDAAERERALAWQPRLLDFTDQPLADIVAEFNRRNPVQLVLADPSLRALRLTVTFRSDNVEAFVRLMESDFGMRADWRGETEIALSRQ